MSIGLGSYISFTKGAQIVIALAMILHRPVIVAI